MKQLMNIKNHSYWTSIFKIILIAGMAIVIPASCGGGGSEDAPQPQPTPQPTPTPTPEPLPDISGLDNLKSFQVDVETDLLSGITFNNGAELTKTEFVFEGETSVIDDPKHFTPEYPGTCTIILTVKSKDGTVKEYKAENLTIKPLEYKAMTVNNIQPVEILPIIGQIEAGDKQAYEHIEHLRVAEVTRIRDMMWEYGAGNHSAEEYQQLMNRLNTGMTREYPLGYSNFTLLGDVSWTAPSLHAQTLWSILDCLVKHASLVVVTGIEESQKSGEELLLEYVKSHPNSINIFGQSSSWDSDTKEEYDKVMSGYYMYPSTDEIEKIFKLYHSKNYLHFVAGTNIETTKNKIYNGEYKADKQGMYSTASWANSDKNSQPGSHLMVTIATDKNGDIDQTNVDWESSKYPIGFANNVLFSGRGFPQHREGVIYGPSGRYTTSDTNYFNVALADLCFQMFAEVKDVDELLEMIRSTALTDYIRLDGQTQELQLMNPAGFFQKYLMPITLPASIKTDETVALEKGYYHGIIFNIPGAEVLIDGQWIAYSDNNKDLFLTQNPMTLQWRLNSDLLRKTGYKQGDTLPGQILVVDDQWHGLNISTDFSIKIE